MKAVVGIDVGGSTTKIVGFDISDNKRTLLKPVTVKATDPVASVYGAFGKFTSENGVDIKDIKRVMLTGVGSTYIGDNIFGVPTLHVDEFTAVGRGGLYLSKLSEAVIVSMGTGTALVYAKSGTEPEYLGGTGVGGGFVYNGKLFTGCNFAAFEVGHMVINADNGPDCDCSRRGCWEKLASATALERMTREAMEAHRESSMWKLCDGDIANASARTAFIAQREGDKTGDEVVRKYIGYLACGLST